MTTMHTHHKDLRELLRAKSVMDGTFTLSSGTKSPCYIDCRTVTLDPRGALLTARAFLSIIEVDKLKPAAVGGLTVGADPIVTSIALLSGIQGGAIPAFIVRKQAKGHGTKRFIEGYKGPAGSRVVIVDDVCASGGSILQAAYTAEEAGYRVIAAICMVDREEGGGDIIRRKYPFYSIFSINDLTRPVIE